MLRSWMLLVMTASLSGCGHCSKLRCDASHGDEARAGCPGELSPLAQPSESAGHVGSYVGGGAPCKGEGPTREEGTWGWDYEGHWFPSRVVLGWWHGRREQGGAGAYAIDGPRPLQAHQEKKE